MEECGAAIAGDKVTSNLAEGELHREERAGAELSAESHGLLSATVCSQKDSDTFCVQTKGAEMMTDL